MAPIYEEALAALEERVSAHALDHAVRVASAAAGMASIYGVDPEQARLAGLLHDWHRETPPAELVRRAEALGIPVGEVDRQVPYLLHGPVAAAELRAVFPDVESEVLQAVAAHTYGSDSMTPLAMIVYVADVVEPERTHEGVDDLRAAVGVEPLGRLFARAYVASVRHLVETRRHIHPVTVQTWNRYVAGETS